MESIASLDWFQGQPKWGMSVNMVKRREKDAERKKATVIERRSRIRGLLKSLGVWDRIERTTIAEQLLMCYWPRISVGLAKDIEADKETSAILKSLKKVIEETTIPLSLFGEAFSVADLHSLLMPVISILHAAVSEDTGLKNFLHETKVATEHLALEHAMPPAIHELYWRLDEALAEFCRIDTRLYYLVPHYGWNEKKKWTARFEIQREEPRMRKVAPDGTLRPAFWCGQPNGKDGIDWLEWPRALIGPDDGGAPLPVYVQSHVLDNLYRKEARALISANWEGEVHDYLWHSLKRHVITPHRAHPGEFLVEYWLNAHKLGYLVVQRLDDIVLVKTFLFLTMNDTPEGDKLREKHNLRRPDKEYLEIDKIHTFLSTDVQFDPELVAIFEECGCGHLFRMWKDPPREEHRQHIHGRAAEMRKYLNLDGKH